MNETFKNWVEEKLPYVAHWPTATMADELALWVIGDPKAAGFTMKEITGAETSEDFPVDRVVEESYSFLRGEIRNYLENREQEMNVGI